MDECVVTFKATVNGLFLIMREEDKFESILEQVEKKLVSAGRFFKGASFSVKYCGKKLTKQEEDKIRELLLNRTGAQIKCFEEDTSELFRVRGVESIKSQNRMKMKGTHFNGINEGKTKFYRGTVRSGQLVSSDGNLVVIGDVNPGGEVTAAGNVIVMGSMRGNVHAGADGNKEAIVAALNLQPLLLKIADVITRCPDDEESRNVSVPELAFVKDGMVYIERFLPQFK